MSISRTHLLAGVFFFYLIFSFVVLPLLSPLRNLGILEPAYIRNAMLPVLLLFIILILGLGKLLRPVSWLQFLLLFMFLQAGVLGVVNYSSGGARFYFSHLFQVFSAYILLRAGWELSDFWGEKFWRRISLWTLISFIFSSIVVIAALGAGSIGRYYTPAYVLILVSAFSAVGSRSMSVFGFVGALLSNKRAVLLAVVLMLIAKFFFYKDRFKGASSLFLGGGVLVFLLLGVGSFSLWAENNEEHPLSQAFNISVGRIESIINMEYSESSVERVSSGRMAEIEAALESFRVQDWFFGYGAGWSIELFDGENIKHRQNIHFTPLSLVAVYGVPIVSIFYIFVFYFLWRAFRVRKDCWGFMQKMSPLYVVGGIVHSFFAYSIFIDWMFFFFIGSMLRALSPISVYEKKR